MSRVRGVIRSVSVRGADVDFSLAAADSGLRAAVDYDWPPPPPPPPPPVNTAAPAFVGTPRDGTQVTLDLGLWTGVVDSFEAQIIDQTSAVVLARQEVDNDSTFDLVGLEGDTLTLRVWAINAGGETLATSAAFGPIEPPGDQLVAAVSFVAAAADATGVGSFADYPVFPIYEADDGDGSIAQGLWPQSNSNVGMTGLQWGWAGSLAAAADFRTAAFSFSDARVKGRQSGNLSAFQGALLVEVPGPGDYIVYGAAGSPGAASPNWGIFDGDPNQAGSASRHQVGNTSTTAHQLLDMAGNIRAHAAWLAVDEAKAGTGVEVAISVAQGGKYYVTVSRATAGFAPNHCFIAVFKKAAA